MLVYIDSEQLHIGKSVVGEVIICNFLVTYHSWLHKNIDIVVNVDVRGMCVPCTYF